MATNPQVVSKLPIHVRTAVNMPFVLTHRGGIDVNVLREMEGHIGTLSGSNFTAFRSALLERHSRHADDLVLSYVSLLQNQMDKNRHRPTKFDKTELHTCVPSVGYLSGVYMVHLLMNREQMLLEMMKRDAMFLSVDHSHKVLKLLSKVGGNKIFDAALQVNNDMTGTRVSCLLRVV